MFIYMVKYENVCNYSLESTEQPYFHVQASFREAEYMHICTVGCSDFHFFSYFWECLTFPLFLGTQEFRKCKKN